MKWNRKQKKLPCPRGMAPVLLCLGLLCALTGCGAGQSVAEEAGAAERILQSAGAWVQSVQHVDQLSENPLDEVKLQNLTGLFFLCLRAEDETETDFDLSVFWDPETENGETLEEFVQTRERFGSSAWSNIGLTYQDVHFTGEDTGWVWVDVWVDYVDPEVLAEDQNFTISGHGEEYRLYYRFDGENWWITDLDWETDGGDWEGPEPLTEEEIAWFNTEYFNSGEGVNMWNMMLSSQYETVAEIDLYQLFYNGVPDTDQPVTDEERSALEEYDPSAADLDVTKVTRAQMEAFLLEHAGVHLEDTQRKGLDQFIYLEEYDAYYLAHGDTNYSNCEILSGTRNADGTISLEYESTFHGDSGTATVTLETSENGYRFLSNVAT